MPSYPQLNPLLRPNATVERCTTIILKRRGGDTRCYIYVEGPDDVSAIQRHRGSKCEVEQLGTRDKVLAMLTEAGKTYNPLTLQKGLDGLFGLVDRDFTHLIHGPDWLPPRTVVLPVANDLESFVIYHRAREIVSMLVKESAGDENVWFAQTQRNGRPLDLLTRNVVAPLGALRVAWQNEKTYIPLDYHNDKPYEAADIAWNLACLKPLEMLDPGKLAEKLPLFIENDLARRRMASVVKVAKGHLESRTGADAQWNFVRGKDLVSCFAHAVCQPGLKIYDRDERYHTIQKIKNFVCSTLDWRTIDDSGLLALIHDATRGDSMKFIYLVSETRLV